MNESDGIEEALEGQLRMLVIAASQAGQNIARLRERSLQKARSESVEHELAELARIEAERKMMHSEIRDVYDPQWWEESTHSQVARMWELTQSWDGDPLAQKASAHMEGEYKSRYGLDLRQLLEEEKAKKAAEPRFDVTEFRNEAEYYGSISKADALASIRFMGQGGQSYVGKRGEISDMKTWIGKDLEVDQALYEKFPKIFTEEQLAKFQEDKAQEERRKESEEIVEAQQLLAVAAKEESQADQARAAQEFEPDPNERAQAKQEAEIHQGRADQARQDGFNRYDSAQRRAQMASDLEAKGIDKEVVASRMRADVSQGRPASEAVRKAPKTATLTARPKRGTSRNFGKESLSR